LAVLAIGLVCLAGCNKYVRAAKAHEDAQGRIGYVHRSNCGNGQDLINRALEEIHDDDPYALDGVEYGSREFYRILERSGELPMVIPCMGGGKFVEGPGGTVVCSKHGASKDIDRTHPDAGRRERGEPRELTGEDLALISWGIGFLFLLAAGYNYTAGGDDVDLLEALKQTALTPPGSVSPNTYALVEGVADADEHLLSPRARTQVVMYVYRQIEEWQEQDKNKVWHTRSRVLKEETEMVPFVVRDESGGAVEVAPGGARIIGKSLLRDVVGASGSATSQGGGGFGLAGKYRNHRYIHEVEGIEVGQPAVVIGPTAPGAMGGARFEAKEQEERPFVVSGRRRPELAQRAGEGAGVSTLLMYGFGVLAVIFLLAGFAIPTGS
jgi:hypothetical protein